MSMMIFSEILFLPDGCPPDDIDAHTFAIKVIYQGIYERRSAEKRGKIAWYSVEHMGSSLSRGGNWAFMIHRFQHWQYRFTFAEALKRAQAEVNSRKVNGRTWAEWQASKAS